MRIAIFIFTELDDYRLLLEDAINTRTADEISFSGTAGRTSAAGTMKFLYHNLNVDLNLENKAKWKSTAGAFAANTALHNSNPASVKEPPRNVAFSAERDMNKSFVNLVIKSALNGLKETMIMSKENRKAFKEDKKEFKKEAKKEAKANEEEEREARRAARKEKKQ